MQHYCFACGTRLELRMMGPPGKGVAFIYQGGRISAELKTNNESSSVNYFSWQEIPSNLSGGTHDRMILEWRLQAQQKESHAHG